MFGFIGYFYRAHGDFCDCAVSDMLRTNLPSAYRDASPPSPEHPALSTSCRQPKSFCPENPISREKARNGRLFSSAVV